MSETDNKEALDYVYAGRRQGVSKMLMIIIPLRNGELQEEMVFQHDRKSQGIIGGIYEGAKFSKAGVVGLGGINIKYKGRWKVTADLIDWQSRDTLAGNGARAAKLEADAKKMSEIERIMMPLRLQYESYRCKRDMEGMDALRAAVISTLLKSPRKDES